MTVNSIAGKGPGRPLVSIVIPTYNRLKYLRKCLESIDRHAGISREVIVVDGGSTDGTVQFLDKQPGILHILQGRLTGTVAANNAGIAIASGEYVCCINDDCELQTGGLEAALQVLTANPRIGMVGLKAWEPNSTRPDAAYVGAVNRHGFLTQNFFVARGDLLRALGGFNDCYWMYGADTDLTASIIALGYSVATTKQVSVIHVKAWEGDEAERPEALAKRAADLRKGAEIFDRRFEYVGPAGPTHRLKALLGRFLRSTLYPPTLGRQTRFGLTSRDVRNITMTRYVSLLDPLRQRGKRHHLVQRPTKRVTDHPANPVAGIRRRLATPKS